MSSALVKKCIVAYEALDKEAQTNQAGQRIWIGKTTALLQSVGISNTYYSKVITTLKKMQCIELLRRGGGNANSIWLLLEKPTSELYESRVLNTVNGESIIAGSAALAHKRIERLENTVAKLIAVLQAQGFSFDLSLPPVVGPNSEPAIEEVVEDEDDFVFELEDE